MGIADIIKGQIKHLYETNPDIHINVRIIRPRVTVEEAPAKNVGVYKNIFQVEENSNGRLNRHTFRYTDVMIGQVVIKELDYAPVNR